MPHAGTSSSAVSAHVEAAQVSCSGAEGTVLPSSANLRDEASGSESGGPSSASSREGLMEVHGTRPVQGRSMPSTASQASAKGSVDGAACLAGHGSSAVHGATAVHAPTAGLAAPAVHGEDAVRAGNTVHPVTAGRAARTGNAAATGDAGGQGLAAAAEDGARGRLALRVRFDWEGQPCGWREEGGELDSWRGSEAVVLRDPLRWTPLPFPLLLPVIVPQPSCCCLPSWLS